MTEEHVTNVLKGTMEQQAELLVQLNQKDADLTKLRVWANNPASLRCPWTTGATERFRPCRHL